MTEYQFNKHNIHHLFCATCGIQSFAHGKGPGGAEMVAVNVRCLDGVEVDALTVKKVDGRNSDRSCRRRKNQSRSGWCSRAEARSAPMNSAP